MNWCDRYSIQVDFWHNLSQFKHLNFIYCTTCAMYTWLKQGQFFETTIPRSAKTGTVDPINEDHIKFFTSRIERRWASLLCGSETACSEAGGVQWGDDNEREGIQGMRQQVCTTEHILQFTSLALLGWKRMIARVFQKKHSFKKVKSPTHQALAWG